MIPVTRPELLIAVTMTKRSDPIMFHPLAFVHTAGTCSPSAGPGIRPAMTPDSFIASVSIPSGTVVGAFEPFNQSSLGTPTAVPLELTSVTGPCPASCVQPLFGAQRKGTNPGAVNESLKALPT